MTEVYSQYLPKSTYMQNESKSDKCIKNHIFSFTNETLFLKKEMKTKNQVISTLIPTQLKAINDL